MAMQAFERGARSLGIAPGAETIKRFERLLELLQTESSRHNITSLRDPTSIVERHFLESIALGLQLQEEGLLKPAATVLDLGSGAGFPGLPLKIVWGEIKLTLLEATAKKARFIQSAVDALGLAPTRVLTGRAETLARDPMLRETQDVVVARAVAALPALVELALPFLYIGGTLAAVKGSRVQEELSASTAALSACGGKVVDQRRLGRGPTLNVVLVEKIGRTPDRYPRRPGQPAAHPLHD